MHIQRRLNFSHLLISITAISSISTAHSAGLERSQQPIAPLFEEGNYAEVSYAYVDPNIQGTDGAGNKVTNMLDDYAMESAAIKVAPTKNTAIALMYNKPWGVDTTYPTGNIFSNSLGTTEAHIETEAIGLIVGGKPNGGNVTIYGGIEYQTVSGYVKAATPLGVKKAKKAIEYKVVEGYIASPAPLSSIEDYENLKSLDGSLPAAQQGLLDTIKGSIGDALTANLAATANSPILYELDYQDESTLVPMVGIAFEKPEIAMRTAITYRAPAKYNIKGTEQLTIAADPTGESNYSDIAGNTEVNFPQTVSLDFQTGLSAKHKLLGMVNARWLDWSKFEVAPPLNAILQDGNPLASYADDQYSVEVAVAKQFTPKLAAEIRASYDSGTGADLSLLGPYDSVTGIAVGAKYDVTNTLEVSGGVQYIRIEGGKSVDSDGNTLLAVDDSDGYAAGIKLGYHF